MPNVSQIWVLGDNVGWLQYPCEVIDILLNLDVPVCAVAGNHDIGLLEGRYGQYPEHWMFSQFGVAKWTAESLMPHHWDYIESLKLVLSLDTVPGGALLFHAKPNNFKNKIITDDDAMDVTDEWAEKFFAFGCTHRSSLFRAREKTGVNPGSVGISLNGIGGVASYALIDECKCKPSQGVVFKSVVYDVEKTINSLLKSSLMECAPGITKAVCLELQTGRSHIFSLIDFVMNYAEKQLGYKPESIPPEIWSEAEQKWCGSTDKGGLGGIV